MRQRLLRAKVNTTLHGINCRNKMCMVRCINANTVNFFTHFIQHYTKISKGFGLCQLRKPISILTKLPTVDITERNNILGMAASV
jgi:hypothetical protein